MTLFPVNPKNLNEAIRAERARNLSRISKALYRRGPGRILSELKRLTQDGAGDGIPIAFA
jgi:hypothetical protein